MRIGFLDKLGEWQDAAALVAGAVPSARIVAQVGIETDAGERLRVDISADEDCVCCQDVRIAASIAYIGYGSRLFVVDLTSRHVATHAMRGYFSHLWTAPDLAYSGDQFSVLASSAGDILAFDNTGKLIWKSEALGIDGVIVHALSDEVLHGDGEWDPPGGWRPFSISSKTGMAVAATTMAKRQRRS